LAFLDLATFWAIFKKFGNFFSNLLVTLAAGQNKLEQRMLTEGEGSVRLTSSLS
jgi:hypothetical protein